MKSGIAALVAVGALVVAGSAVAQDLTQGRSEISVSGMLEFDTPVGTDWNVAGGYGYFIQDSWEVGGSLSLSDNDVVSAYKLGAFTEYNFLTETPWVPYVGGALSWGQVNPDEGSREDAVVITPYGGLKYFISNDVSIYGQAEFDFASDDLYADENGNLDDNTYLFALGVRFYIGP